METVKLEEIQAAPVKTDDPQLTIDLSSRQLKIGSHSFTLQVEDDSGNVSTPITIKVVILDREAPTAVADVRDARGVLAEGNRINHGASFILDASKSVDAGGGRIVRYQWALVD